MRTMRPALRGFAAALLATSTVSTAGASTFGRVDLAYLVAENETIVVGEALGGRSYWNDEGTFILTDVQVAVSEVLKGSVATREITVTMPGGKVGDLTSVIVDGAELHPGNWYVLFLRQGDLLGRRDVRYVRDHGQGVFDLRVAKGGLRAVSQARPHSLIADAWGNVEPVGGAEGLPYSVMTESVRELAAQGRNVRPEVKR